MTKTPWIPFKPVPQWPKVKRVTFASAVTQAIIERWSAFADRCRWKYYRLVYQTDDKRLIRCSLASETLNRLYRNRKDDRDAQREIAEHILSNHPSADRDVLSRGTLELHGWREMCNSLDMVCFLSWTPFKGKRIYRMLVPLMQILVRDKGSKDEYDPVFSLKEFSQLPPEFQTHRSVFTPERQSSILRSAFVILAEAIRIEEDARTRAL